MPSPSASRAAAPITSALTEIVNGTISVLLEQSLAPMQRQIDDLRELLVGSDAGRAKVRHVGSAADMHTSPDARVDQLLADSKRLQQRLDRADAERRQEISLVNDALQTLEDRLEHSLGHSGTQRQDEFGCVDDCPKVLEQRTLPSTVTEDATEVHTGAFRPAHVQALQALENRLEEYSLVQQQLLGESSKEWQEEIEYVDGRLKLLEQRTQAGAVNREATQFHPKPTKLQTENMHEKQQRAENVARRAAGRLLQKWLGLAFEEWRCAVARAKRIRNLSAKVVLRMENVQTGRSFVPWLVAARQTCQDRRQKLSETLVIDQHRADADGLRANMHEIRDEIWGQVDVHVSQKAALLTTEYKDQVAEMQCRLVSESAARIEWSEMHVEKELSDTLRRQQVILRTVDRMHARCAHGCSSGAFAMWRDSVSVSKRLQNLRCKATQRVDDLRMGRRFLPWLAAAAAHQLQPVCQTVGDAFGIASKLEDVDLQLMDLSEDVGKLELKMREEIVMVQVRCERITRGGRGPSTTSRSESRSEQRRAASASLKNSSPHARKAPEGPEEATSEPSASPHERDAEALAHMKAELAILRRVQSGRVEQLRSLQQLRQDSHSN